MVTGAVAAIVYGEPRLTTDIDLVVVLEDDDVRRLAAAYDTRAFYVPPTDVMAIESRRPVHGHFNLIHGETALKADIYPAGADPFHAWALARRKSILVSEEAVWVAPPEYVMIRKLEYLRDGGSDKHRRDIQAMLRELGTRVDEPALLAEIGGRGLMALWRTVT
jgi:hypothetical protein